MGSPTAHQRPVLHTGWGRGCVSACSLMSLSRDTQGSAGCRGAQRRKGREASPWDPRPFFKGAAVHSAGAPPLSRGGPCSHGQEAPGTEAPGPAEKPRLPTGPLPLERALHHRGSVLLESCGDSRGTSCSHFGLCSAWSAQGPSVSLPHLHPLPATLSPVRPAPGPLHLGPCPLSLGKPRPGTRVLTRQRPPPSVAQFPPPLHLPPTISTLSLSGIKGVLTANLSVVSLLGHSVSAT